MCLKGQGTVKGNDSMELLIHEFKQGKVAELMVDEVIIHSPEVGLDLLGTAYYDGAEILIWPVTSLSPDFFDLRTGFAGEILQKFSNYRMRLIVLGDIPNTNSKALHDFIYECNQGKLVNFVNSRSELFEELRK